MLYVLYSPNCHTLSLSLSLSFSLSLSSLSSLFSLSLSLLSLSSLSLSLSSLSLSFFLSLSISLSLLSLPLFSFWWFEYYLRKLTESQLVLKMVGRTTTQQTFIELVALTRPKLVGHYCSILTTFIELYRRYRNQ